MKEIDRPYMEHLTRGCPTTYYFNQEHSPKVFDNRTPTMYSTQRHI